MKLEWTEIITIYTESIFDIIYRLIIINMAKVRYFGLMSDKFKIYPCLALDIIIFR